MIVWGARSIVHSCTAGLWSGIPSEPLARTRNVWSPCANPGYVAGEVHDENGSASSAHWKVEPVSLEEKTNFAVLSVVSTAGPEMIVVSGGDAPSGRAIVH